MNGVHSIGNYTFAAGLFAFVPSSVIAIALALIPMFEVLSAFSWFFGAVLAGLVYHLVADRTRECTDVPGRHLAQSTAASGIH